MDDVMYDTFNREMRAVNKDANESEFSWTRH